MATKIEQAARPREPLTKERILQAAVALADEGGVESLSMRRIAQELGVVPMALYKHVANKDEMLDGMVDVVVGEIDPPLEGADWKTRDARADPVGPPGAAPPPVGVAGHRVARRARRRRCIAYMDSMIGIFRAGGFSIDLTHHAMHAMGSRLLGLLPGAVRRHARAIRMRRRGDVPQMAERVPQHRRARARARSPTTRDDRRRRVRRPVRVRVRPRPDARRSRAAARR